MVIFARQGEDGSEAARLLIESMQVQCKIYEEWIEVMSDYSTVFSDDHRGVAEHYGSGGGGGGGGAEESEIEGATNDNGNAAVSLKFLSCVCAVSSIFNHCS